jgi:hypothetical protein
VIINVRRANRVAARMQGGYFQSPTVDVRLPVSPEFSVHVETSERMPLLSHA